LGKKKKAPMLDVWSIGHFALGIGLAVIGMPLLWIFLLGIAWEIVEHSFIGKLADVGGEEGIDNIIADIVLVFLGGAAWVFLFGY